jgi:hypothetical protein
MNMTIMISLAIFLVADARIHDEVAVKSPAIGVDGLP